jgi:hypothetical protein
MADVIQIIARTLWHGIIDNGNHVTKNNTGNLLQEIAKIPAKHNATNDNKQEWAI